ncbi:MAG: hypothetical protein M3P18_11040 [Actinomycetota bacterium]|nr:hypothetical protein [Actinomycetota bacterium]
MAAQANTEQLRKALASAARRRAKAHAELIELVLAAVAAGIPKRDVAALAQISRQGVYDILREYEAKD